MPRASSQPSCIAVIADVVRSRRIRNRSAAQTDLEALVAYLNDALRPDLLATFHISRGDEIQALFARGAAIPDLVWEASSRFEHPIRFGVGLGTLNTGFGPDPRLTDGPAWWAARAALQSGIESRRNGGVFQGFGEKQDLVLTGLATVLSQLRDSLTRRQKAILSLLRAGNDMVRAAETLGITRQAVSDAARAAGWRAYEEGEAAWQALLDDYDYTDEWKRAGA
jgi:hypothetical protein